MLLCYILQNGVEGRDRMIIFVKSYFIGITMLNFEFIFVIYICTIFPLEIKSKLKDLKVVKANEQSIIRIYFNLVIS